MYICSFFSPLAFVWQKLKLEERETGKSMLQGVRTLSPRTQNTGQDTVTQDTGNSTQSPRTFNYQESVDQYYWLCHISALFICLLTSSTKGCCWKLTTHLSIITLAGFPNDSTLLKSRGWGTWLFITQSSISPFLHLSWKPWMSAVSFGFSMFQRGSRSLISHRRFHLPFNTGYLPMVFYIPLISTWSPRQQQLLSHKGCHIPRESSQTNVSLFVLCCPCLSNIAVSSKHEGVGEDRRTWYHTLAAPTPRNAEYLIGNRSWGFQEINQTHSFEYQFISM